MKTISDLLTKYGIKLAPSQRDDFATDLRELHQYLYDEGLKRAVEVVRPFETKRWVYERGCDENASEAIESERRKAAR